MLSTSTTQASSQSGSDFLDSPTTDPRLELVDLNGQPDPRILNLSYSSLLTLHSCPRKYQLDKLQATSERALSLNETITFSYGHIVGEGIQLALEGKSEDEIIWRMFLGWKPELFADNPKQSKSFAHALYAVQKFTALRAQGFLDGYELVYYNGKPAVELSFIISLPNGFKFRGFVDAVLKHSDTGEIVVLECKTSSAANLNPATFKNSAQAIGYSVVLDVLFPELSSYKVIYLVYSTKQLNYDILEFTKSFSQRARWIRELVLDCDSILSYETQDLYPMRGESCFIYFRECNYLGLCQMDTHKLVKPPTVGDIEDVENKNENDYEIKLTLADLISSQLTKVT